MVRPLLNSKAKSQPDMRPDWLFFACATHDLEHLQMATYIKRLNSSTQLVLVHDSGLARRVLDRAETEIRNHWQTLPLWAYRAFQHVGRGTLTYSETWQRLHAAALEAGARESWIDRSLYHAVSNSRIHRQAPPELAHLAGGLR